MAVSENTYALTTLERVKEHGDIKAVRSDAELVHLINEVSARIETALGRHLISRVWTHDGTTLPRLDSCGGALLWLPERPVTAVSSLKVYPTSDALTEGYDEDFLIRNHEGIIELVNGNSFYSGRQLVAITYTAGYLTTGTASQLMVYGWNEKAADLQLAATMQTVWQWHQKEREREGVASRSEAGVSVSYLNDTWLPEVADILARYAAPAIS